MTVDLNDKDSKLSYALGLDVGSSFTRLPMNVDLDAFCAGVTDVFNCDKEPQLTKEEFEATMLEFQNMIKERGEEIQKELATENQNVGTEFLNKNKERAEVTVTESGLQYEVITKGNGKTPLLTDTVKVHYQGTLIDNTEFDSSIKRGKPAVFPVNGVIPGWTEALQIMSVGSKYRLVIPANLAYAERGAGQMIGPNATLIFEVELLDILA